jgi:hypothetical protein
MTTEHTALLSNNAPPGHQLPGGLFLPSTPSHLIELVEKHSMQLNLAPSFPHFIQ